MVLQGEWVNGDGDIFFACPLSIIGIILVFAAPRWGYYLLAWVSFWFVWANVMTTATSLRFENPKKDLSWFIVFPFGFKFFLGFATEHLPTSSGQFFTLTESSILDLLGARL